MSVPEQNAARPIVEVFGQHPGYGFAGEGVQTATGNYTETSPDLRFPASMLGLLDWTRTYNSLSTVVGPLGRGWTTAFSARLTAPGQDGGPAPGQPAAFHDEDGRVLTFTAAEGGRYDTPTDIEADLNRADDGAFTLAYRGGAVWLFDADGRLTGRTMEGQRVTVERDDQARPVRMEHTFGRRLTLGYDGDGRLVRVECSDGRTVTYGYADDGTLASVTYPGDLVARYTATPGGLVAGVSDPDGNLVVENTYGPADRVQHQDLATGMGLDLAYDDETRVTTVTARPSGAAATFTADATLRLVAYADPAGNTATFEYDAAGRLTAASSPGGTRLVQRYDTRGNELSSEFGGAVTTWTYDDHDRVTTTTDPAGAVTRYTYTGDDHVPTTVTDPGGGVMRYTVQSGLITAQTDADGYGSTFSYDEAGNLTTATDASGAMVRYSYDETGNRVEQIGPGGETSRYGYDAAGRRTSQTDPSGAVTTYEYSAAGLLTQVTDPTGASTTMAYNAAGLITHQADPLGRAITYEYDPDGNLTTTTGPDGGATRAEYDVLGQPTVVTDPVGTEVRYTYDADGNQVTTVTPQGTTSMSYDARSNPVAVAQPDGATVRFGYDLADRPTSVTDPLGGTITTAYDAIGNPVGLTNPVGSTIRRTFTPGGRLASATDALGRQVTYTYDAAGRLATVTNPEGGVTRYAYDAAGRPISVTSPSGLVVRRVYDPAGRLAESIDARGWITRYEYSARGELTAVISPSGAVRRLRHDAAGQLTTVTDPNGSPTAYTYDTTGHLDTVTDAKGAVTRYTHDGAGRQTSSTDPLGRTTHRAYDASGNLVSVTDPEGHTQHLEYDSNRRLIRRTGTDGATISFGYDANGRRTSMTDPSGTTRYAYDAAGHVLTVTYPDGGVLTATYDAAGQRTTLRYPDGLEADYRYDRNGRLISLHDSRAGDAVYALDADGRLLTEQLPGRNARRYHYEGGLLHRFTAIHDDHLVAVSSFRRDPDGRIVVQRDRDQRREFRYDPAGQLIGLTHRSLRPDHDDESTIRIRYDVVGNRMAVHRGPNETWYRYDAADQLVASGTAYRHTEYRYDGSGRLVEEIQGPRRCSIEYNGFGLPATTTRFDEDERERLHATYNGSGLLAGLHVSLEDHRHGREHDDDHEHEHGRHGERAALVRYRWSVGSVPQIITQSAEPALDDAEHDRGERQDADFVYGYGRTFASSRHGAAAFAKDAFGSAVRTPATQAWAQAESYDPFGTPLFGTPLDEDEPHPRRPELPRFGYRGELTRGSLVYLRARSYDTRLGRFLTPDPVTALRGLSSIGNPYVYAHNDPLDMIDPLGKLGFGNIGAAIEAVIKAVTAAVGPCRDCQNPGNAITRHLKCFQNRVCLRTRGYFTVPAALDADPASLALLWNTHRPERAAHALTIHILNARRAGHPGNTGNLLRAVPMSFNVDWEVRRPNQQPRLRPDVITEGSNPGGSGLLEVRVWEGPATAFDVQDVLNRYVDNARDNWNGVRLNPSRELVDWGQRFSTGRDTAYVWGLGNQAGHIYFAGSNDVPDDKAVRIIILELILGLNQVIGRMKAPTPQPAPPEIPPPPEPPAPPGSRVDGQVDGPVEVPGEPGVPELPEFPELPLPIP